MMDESSATMNMDIEEEFIKPKEDSPAITEATSYTSSPESTPSDESKHSSIRRNLFKDSPKDTIDRTFNSPGLVIRERGSKQGDATSVTSSETTAIPSWNLSMKDATERDVEVPLENFILAQPIPLMTPPPNFPVDQSQPILSSPSSFASDETQLSGENQVLENKTISNYPVQQDDKEGMDVQTKEMIKPTVVMEDPPEAPTSCNAVLNVAEIVMAFGQSARQRYQDHTENVETVPMDEPANPPKEEASMGSPPPIMTSRHVSESSSEGGDIRSLAQERDALKTNTQRDAYTISKLQQAIETQKQLNSLKEVEIEDKHTELQILTSRIRTLQKEQEDYLERETELRETINILKKELDKMTLLKTVPSDELDQSKLESEPSSYQDDILAKEVTLAETRAREQQERIEELERSLEEKEKENFDLQTKIDWLNDQRKEGNRSDQYQKVTENAKLDKDDVFLNDEIESRLNDIMKRLEAVEIEKNEIEKEGAKRSEENCEEDTNSLNQNESEHNGVKINVSEDPDEIEATKLKGKANADLDPGKQTAWCCGWGSTPDE